MVAKGSLPGNHWLLNGGKGFHPWQSLVIKWCQSVPSLAITGYEMVAKGPPLAITGYEIMAKGSLPGNHWLLNGGKGFPP